MRILKGNVIDTRTKIPLVGAQVFFSDAEGNPIKNNSGNVLGTTTDEEGKYSLALVTIPVYNIVSGQGSLPISNRISAKFFDYETQTIPVSETNNFELIPKGAYQETEEVEIIGRKPVEEQKDSWINKNKVAVLIASALLVMIGGILLVRNSK